MAKTRGRPALNKPAMTISLRPDTREWLREYAQATDRTQSAVVDRILREFAKRNPIPNESAAS